MIAFIDEHRAVHGVEPICKVLPIAPSTYHSHAARQTDPSKAPARWRSDAELSVAIRRIWDENFQVYGVRKVWRQLRREGLDVARCTVARLMRRMGLKGTTRGKAVRTTISNRAAPCPADRVKISSGLIHHSDRGSQYVAIKYTERLAEAGVEPSVGSVGDSYDNALAETVNGLYKTEVIRRRGPWRSLEAVEFATLEWVDWFNNRRLLEPIGNIPPAEAEARYYAQTDHAAMAA